MAAVSHAKTFFVVSSNQRHYYETTLCHLSVKNNSDDTHPVRYPVTYLLN